MSIRYFYNMRLVRMDPSSLKDDILSAVRKGYFENFSKIKDKIVKDSSLEDAVSYDYTLESSKPMQWSVKTLGDGKLLEESKPLDSDRYCVSVYSGDRLFKRLLFSKLHTLLKVEYFDLASSEVAASLEPRRAQSGLCVLYKSFTLRDPLVLYSAPSIDDERVKSLVSARFSDYFVEAYTNEGLELFLSAEQIMKYRDLISQAEKEIGESRYSSAIDKAPLADKISAKDFNIKRNLAASLDITKAEEFKSEFGCDERETDEPAEVESDKAEYPKALDDVSEAIAEETVSENEQEYQADSIAEKVASVLSDCGVISAPIPESEFAKPDKIIESDGELFRYYGELDQSGMRNGYGRTVTDNGRTAYEGYYIDDKRSGVGSYFYKDGSLCYYGGWEDNLRTGVGVGVSSVDGSIHAGRWKDNKPVCDGARLSGDGELKFVCKELSSGGTALINFLPDDSAVFAEYDERGAKLRERKISLKDLFTEKD